MKSKRWASDLELKHERDFQGALRVLNSKVGVYWNEEDGPLLKEPEEIADFLQFLIDRNYEFEDLTPSQQNLLQNVRRVHNMFWRRFDKIIEEYDEEKAQLDKEKDSDT
jgi:hypothetical protein